MNGAALRQLGVVLVAVLVFGHPGAFGADEKQPGPNDVPQVIRSLPEGDEGPASGLRTGTVKTLGPGSITVEFTEPLKTTTYNTDETGRLIQTTLNVYPPLPATELKLTADLAAGKCMNIPGLGTYRASDVQVGDRVDLEYARSQAGVWTCKSISIVRRPGGSVPKAIADPSARFRGYAWHEYCQAYQDFEERGITVPLRFLPDYADRIAPLSRNRPDTACCRTPTHSEGRTLTRFCERVP
ncbi:hypothetical protein R5W23_001394 [Gemmata sp. JC673]|uniref:DUF5666 domain-containing protein n=1 Tax=Gemmata algarum TaxID=2975278 RepID=A0ABU5EY44_9BACT|nr:hypothetical protein [Gemmata algarum]MDY3560169.1 hypothetical protein [Gemmata algarum]